MVSHSGSVAMLSESGASGYADIRGENAYKNTLLQFDNYWTAVGNDVKVGGLIGWIAASGIVVEHSLNSGSVHCDATANRPMVDGYWVAIENEAPALRSFTKK